jgi:hypothetical protein
VKQGPGQPGSEGGGRQLQGVGRNKLAYSRQAQQKTNHIIIERTDEVLKNMKKANRVGGSKARLHYPQTTNNAQQYEQYRQQKISADTEAQLASKSFSEYMSKRGLLNSGEASQAQIMNNIKLQGVKGNLSTQEQLAQQKLNDQTVALNYIHRPHLA